MGCTCSEAGESAVIALLPLLAPALLVTGLIGPSEAPRPGVCAPDPEPPSYYAFPLVSTRRVPGTGPATGTGHVSFGSSPFGVAVSADGSYELDVWLEFDGLLPPREGGYVVWFTTPSLDQVERAGVLDASGRFRGRVHWNKFLTVVTLEPDPAHDAGVWTGPIVLRGMSKSGLMHTMAGHGPFEKENCATYGY